MRSLPIILVYFSVLFPSCFAIDGQADRDTVVQLKTNQILDDLPACSALRTELQEQNYGSGNDLPYMRMMRRLGVWRALIEVRARIRKGRPQQLRVERQLYFSKLDGADSQITDADNLKTIEDSGLSRLLHDVAESGTLTAPIFRGPDFHFRQLRQADAFVELFADSRLPEEKILLVPVGHRDALAIPALYGDSLELKRLLETRNFSQRELNLAVFISILSKFDNTTTIRLLLNAGADVNARAPDGSTPLIEAVGHPCNFVALMNAGADASAHDRWNRTALQIAREEHDSIAIETLEMKTSR